MIRLFVRGSRFIFRRVGSGAEAPCARPSLRAPPAAVALATCRRGFCHLPPGRAQKQAEEAAAQRAVADAQFKDVSEQLDSERSRVANLEVRGLPASLPPRLPLSDLPLTRQGGLRRVAWLGAASRCGVPRPGSRTPACLPGHVLSPAPAFALPHPPPARPSAPTTCGCLFRMWNTRCCRGPGCARA